MVINSLELVNYGLKERVTQSCPRLGHGQGQQFVGVLLLPHFDLDGFRLCLLSFLNLDIQHSILESGFNIGVINIIR